MPVDDLSRSLGRLDASVEELVRQSRALFSRTDETTAQMHSVAATVEQLLAAVGELKKDVKELRGARDRGRGFLAAVTLMGGAAGAAAAKLLALFTAH